MLNERGRSSDAMHRYVDALGERITEARRSGYASPRYRDMDPVLLVEGIYASFDGFIACSQGRERIYSWLRPSSSFLEEAITNLGYVPDPAVHFEESARANAAHRSRGGCAMFQATFNRHMTPLYRIMPHTTLHRSGRALIRTHPEREPNPEDLSQRVHVASDTAEAVRHLRDMRIDWDLHRF